MRIGNKEFKQGQTYVMGILNVTPDSFSDGGTYNQMDAALFHAKEMMQEGAAILDIGGESTRPGYQQISVQEEIARVIPVVERLKKEYDLPLSVDTYKSEVAEAALQAGADLINDIWGLKYDMRMAKVIAQYGAACCLMHNRQNTSYENFLEDVCLDLQESLSLAKAAGIANDRILLDPGVGFAKDYEQNLQTIASLKKIKTLGFPVLLGASRKSVIGNTLHLPADERLEGTLVTTVYAVQQGCMFVRVHDVKENIRAIQMANAIEQARHE